MIVFDKGWMRLWRSEALDDWDGVLHIGPIRLSARIGSNTCFQLKAIFCIRIGGPILWWGFRRTQEGRSMIVRAKTLQAGDPLIGKECKECGLVFRAGNVVTVSYGDTIHLECMASRSDGEDEDIGPHL